MYFKYFTANETHIWINILQDLVNSYNNSFHSSIAMKPINAIKEDNSEAVWYNLYGENLEKTFGKQKFKVGESERISKFKSIFSKGYLPNFTEEVFKIKQIIFTKPIVYKLEDYQNEPIDGYFYEYKIEKVLKYKTINEKKLGLVKWKGYDSKFNSWELISSLKNI
jgi:hypothetical protein